MSQPLPSPLPQEVQRTAKHAATGSGGGAKPGERSYLDANAEVSDTAASAHLGIAAPQHGPDASSTATRDVSMHSDKPATYDEGHQGGDAGTPDKGTENDNSGVESYSTAADLNVEASGVIQAAPALAHGLTHRPQQQTPSHWTADAPQQGEASASVLAQQQQRLASPTSDFEQIQQQRGPNLHEAHALQTTAPQLSTALPGTREPPHAGMHQHETAVLPSAAQLSSPVMLQTGTIQHQTTDPPRFTSLEGASSEADEQLSDLSSDAASQDVGASQHDSDSAGLSDLEEEDDTVPDMLQPSAGVQGFGVQTTDVPSGARDAGAASGSLSAVSKPLHTDKGVHEPLAMDRDMHPSKAAADELSSSPAVRAAGESHPTIYDQAYKPVTPDEQESVESQAAIEQLGEEQQSRVDAAASQAGPQHVAAQHQFVADIEGSPAGPLSRAKAMLAHAEHLEQALLTGTGPCLFHY